MTEGKQWASEELLGLRAARFCPTAWKRFLSDSFGRAGRTRRIRPALATQARAWSAVGLVAGLAASLGARRAAIAAPTATRWSAWWLSTAAMLDWHLGMVEGEAGEPRERLSRADALTLVRLGLVPFIYAQASRPHHRAPFALLMTAAAVTDVLDGAVARRDGSTRLGRDLDLVADVLVGTAGARAARSAGWIRPAAARLVLMRYALPVAIVSAGYFGRGHRPPRTGFGDTRLGGAVVLAGLVVSPAAPRAADILTSAGSVATLVLARPRRGAEIAA